VSDIDAALMDSLKVLDPDGPIKEAESGVHQARINPHLVAS
jgi:hypothetical protein